MKLYIAVTEDRRREPDPQPFTTAEAAIAHARAEVEDLRKGVHDVEEVPDDGFLFYATVGTEGDAVFVVERNLDQPQSALQVAAADHEAERYRQGGDWS